MVSEVIETSVETDPAPQEVETEAPAEAASAAPETETAAVEQVQVDEPAKPEYMTRADWEKEKAEVAAKAASDALEFDRQNRQRENARKANQEKRDAEDKAELIDTVKAAFGAQGVYEVPDEAVVKAIDRTVRKRAEQIAGSSLDAVDQAWDYLTAPAYGKQASLDDSFESAAKRLGPKVQHLVDTIRPVIEAKAREGYVAESEIPKLVDAEIARRNARARDGQEPLKRPEGQPSVSNVMSWTAYMALSEAERMAMPDDKRREIITADRKVRLGH